MLAPQDIPALILKKLEGTISADEAAALEAWGKADPANQVLVERLLDEPQVAADVEAYDSLWSGTERYQRMEDNILSRTSKVHKRRRMMKWLPYAAAALLAVVSATWLFTDNGLEGGAPELVEVGILPGGNRATLTLADGRVIDLDESQESIVIHNDSISYADHATVVTWDNNNKPIEMLALATPRGGTYQITLADGTEVWLNAESTLRYPAKFAGDERVVEIEGEAYFAVTRDVSRPFKVISRGQIIEVLGTEFNVSAYAGEKNIQTTLIKGIVRVTPDGKDTAILRPGQQASVDEDDMRVAHVDVGEYTAWKEGYFYFNGDSPQHAFSQLSRWYDIQVIYRDERPTVSFYGKIARDKPLQSLLTILKKAGLEFEVTQNTNGYQLVVGSESITN